MKRYNLFATVNYPDDEVGSSWAFDTLDELIALIKRGIELEVPYGASSFVFIVTARGEIQ